MYKTVILYFGKSDSNKPMIERKSKIFHFKIAKMYWIKIENVYIKIALVSVVTLFNI